MKENKKFLDSISELIANVHSENDESSNEYLVSIGENPKEIENNGNVFFEKLNGKIRLEIAREKKVRFNVLLKTIQFEGGKLVESARGNIAKIISGDKEEQIALNFRKLEKLSEDDLAEIKSEIELLEKLNELDDL